MSRQTNLDAVTGEKTTGKACAAVFAANPQRIGKAADILGAAIDSLPYITPTANGRTNALAMLGGAFFPQNSRKPNARRGFGETEVIVESLRLFGGEVEKVSINCAVGRGGHDGRYIPATVRVHVWLKGERAPRNLTVKGDAFEAPCGCFRKERGLVAKAADRMTVAQWHRAILGALKFAQDGADYLRETSRPEEHEATGRDRLGKSRRK